MAVSEQRVLPPEFIEAAGKTFLEDLSKATGQFKDADLSKIFGPQFVAGQDPLQSQAISVATAQDGLGSFRPFLQTAATQAGEAAKQAGLAGQFVGPQAYQQLCLLFKKMLLELL